MSLTGDQMELREEDIRKHYPAALALLEGFDHTPRIARAGEPVATERSSGVGTRRRFRSTTPGLVTRSTVRPEGVRLLERIEAMDSRLRYTDMMSGLFLIAGLAGMVLWALGRKDGGR